MQIFRIFTINIYLYLYLYWIQYNIGYIAKTLVLIYVP